MIWRDFRDGDRVSKEIKKSNHQQYLILIFVFLAVTLLFFPADYNFILIKEIVLISGVALFFIICFPKNELKIKKSFLFFFLFYFWILISFIVSKFKYAGIPAISIFFVCFVLFFLVAHSYLDESKISDIIILSFIPAVVVGLLQVISPQQMKIFMVFGDRIPSTFGNPNFFGAYISALIPFLISRFLTTKNLFYKLILFFITLVLMVLVYFTGSKAALIALFGGTSVYLYIKYKKLIKNNKFIVAFFVFFVFLMVLFAIYKHRTFEHSLFFRQQVWKGTIQLIANHFILGTGPGSFSIFFPQYRPAELMKWTYEHSYQVSYPENIFLHIASETGIIGLILFLVCLYFVFKYGFSSKPEYPASLMALLISNSFGVDINYAPSLLLFTVICGIMVRNQTEYFVLKPFAARIIGILVVIFLILISVFWIKKHLSGIYTKTGVYYSKNRNFDIAIKYYKTALAYYNKNLEALYFMGSSYYDSGEIKKALEVFKFIEKIAPDYVLLRYKIAKIYNEEGLYDEAIEEYKKMLKTDPYLKEALVELAYIYYNKKNSFEEAEKCILKAIEKYNNDPSLFSNLGNIYFMAKKTDKAIEAFNKAIAIKEDKDYYYNLGCVYFTINDIVNAELYLKKAQSMAPDDDKINKMLQLLERYKKQNKN